MIIDDDGDDNQEPARDLIPTGGRGGAVTDEDTNGNLANVLMYKVKKKAKSALLLMMNEKRLGWSIGPITLLKLCTNM